MQQREEATSPLGPVRSWVPEQLGPHQPHQAPAAPEPAGPWGMTPQRCSSWPCEDDRAGEIRALLPPFSAGGGTAAASSFFFFAEDVGLIDQGRASGNDEYKQGQGEA